jgi:hypothetical protein
MGQTALNTFICKLPWHAGVFYNELQGQFYEDKIVLSRYLGPTELEVGLVLTAKLLKGNGEVVWRNTFCHLQQEE